MDDPHYLGPIISSSSYDPNKAAGVAGNGKPTRIKFHNCLPTGSRRQPLHPGRYDHHGRRDGTAAHRWRYTLRPLSGALAQCTPRTVPPCTCTAAIPPGSATVHRTSGRPPPRKVRPIPKGVSVYNVPDMDGGVEPVGTLTFYYTNQQSARLMFYHDHAYGITRLNVYAGEAAGYLVTIRCEETLIGGWRPSRARPLASLPDDPCHQIPLVIQDKTFVPDDGAPGGQLGPDLELGLDPGNAAAWATCGSRTCTCRTRTRRI